MSHSIPAASARTTTRRRLLPGRDCRACPIGERATQTVFGEGPPDAPLVIVGEQPGDEEDHVGRPFVGPAGRLLDELMASANLARDRVYLTNAVKHFKWEPRGKRRLHARLLRAADDVERRMLESTLREDLVLTKHTLEALTKRCTE